MNIKKTEGSKHLTYWVPDLDIIAFIITHKYINRELYKQQFYATPQIQSTQIMNLLKNAIDISIPKTQNSSLTKIARAEIDLKVTIYSDR